MDKKEAEQAHAKMNKALTDVKGCVLELRQDDLQKRPGGGKASPAAARFGATLQFQCDSDAARA